MGTISINYSSLSTAVSQTRRLSKDLTAYQGQITSSVVNKFSSLSGSDSKGYISAAEGYASKKITELTTKASIASSFANDLEKFVDLAERADSDTAKNISTLGSAVVGKRTFWEKAGDWIYNTFCVDFVNSIPVVSAIANCVKWVWGKASSVLEDVHTWFKYKEGKYVWNEIKAGAGIIAAVAAALVAVATAGTVFAVIAAGAAIVVAIIATVNGVISIYNNHKAKKQYKNGQLGQSRYHGSIEGFSDAVSKYDMGGEMANNAWKIFGEVVDDVEVVCKVVIAINGVLNLGGVKDPTDGKIYSYDFSKENIVKNIKADLGFSNKRYSIDPETGKAITYQGEKSGYKVGDRWSFKNMFSSRQDGTGKQYLRKYFGFGSTDPAFFNSSNIAGMAENPSNTTQTVSKLYGQLSTGKKISKTILDTGSIIDTTIGKVEKIDKISSNVQKMISGESVWKTIKDGMSTINAVNSNLNFIKGFSSLGKITDLFDSTFQTGDQIYTHVTG